MPQISFRLFPLILLFVLTACEKNTGSTDKKIPAAPIPVVQAALQPRAIFREAVSPMSFELATGALSVWRSYSAIRPALVLFASHPMLTPTSAELRDDIGRLIATASDQEIIRRGRATASDTLLVSPQTVSAALDAKIFSEIVVVLSTREAPDAVSLEKFVKRATEAGFLTTAEGTALTLNGSTISGTVRGIPLRIAHPDGLPPVNGPMLLHVDLGYFKESYANEVKTPIYDLIYQFATSVRDAGYQPTATTLSYSNQEVGYALTSRFVLRDLAQIMLHPEYLAGDTPASWKLRASALYASIMFNEAEAQNMTVHAAKETPGDAAALFDLALLHFQHAEPELGFQVLDQAVAIDPGFAPAYVELADQGQSMGQWGKSFELLNKAVSALPNDHELRVRYAGDLIQRGRTAEARPHLETLQQLTWSDIYHKGMPETLLRMQEAAKVDSTQILPDAEQTPRVKPTDSSRSMPPSHMGIPMHKRP